MHTAGDGKRKDLARNEVASDKSKRCNLRVVLLVPRLSYNLLSVSKAAKAGKIIEFDESGCQVLDTNKKLIVTGNRAGSLYYLNCLSNRNEQATIAEQETKVNIWHRRFAHLGMQNLQRLAREKLVEGFDIDISEQLDFCEMCAEGKHHKSHVPTSGSK